jgi:hypothetical protein
MNLRLLLEPHMTRIHEVENFYFLLESLDFPLIISAQDAQCNMRSARYDIDPHLKPVLPNVGFEF